MRYRPFALSCLIQVKTIYNTKHSKLNRLIRVKIKSLEITGNLLHNFLTINLQ